ncbi:MAG: ornithine carbamoyltransferase [Phycisphaerales bacterium]|nr:MAG: ornithine carbamoyltransferase [Phycisphaerales bacterium]
MGADLKGRNFVSMLDLSREEILEVLDTARRLKEDHKAMGKKPLKRKTLAMIFLKPSLRTRVSFETGMTQLGGHAIYLAPTDISLGKRETTEDIALVLSRYVDIIMARVFGHDVVVDLAKHATVPVINGLSDFEHPCQIMADFQTIIERKDRLDGVKACYIGDGNNVAHSLMFGAAQVGMHMTVITPPGYEPKGEVTKQAAEIGGSTGSKINVSNDMATANGADVLYTDVWASMGQEDQAAARKKLFAKYRIDGNAMKLAHPNAIILHCLPAHYDEEIDYATSRLPNSAIFDQAENRLHAQKAIMAHLAGKV